jgi:hypothetical protein
VSASTGSLRECRFLDNDLQSLAHLAARLWLRGTKKDAPAAGGVPGQRRLALRAISLPASLLAPLNSEAVALGADRA